MNGKAEGRNIDQKFAVICYAAAVCISAVSSAIVSATVDVSSNLYIYLSYLLPQVGYIGVFAVMWYRYKKGFGGIVVKENVKGTDYLLAVPIAAGVLFFGLLPNFGMTKLFELVGIKAAVVVPALSFVKKKSGSPIATAAPKQISCRLVRLNITLLLIFVKSFGTVTYAISNLLSGKPYVAFDFISPYVPTRGMLPCKQFNTR